MQRKIILQLREFPEIASFQQFVLVLHKIHFISRSSQLHLILVLGPRVCYAAILLKGPMRWEMRGATGWVGPVDLSGKSWFCNFTSEKMVVRIKKWNLFCKYFIWEFHLFKLRTFYHLDRSRIKRLLSYKFIWKRFVSKLASPIKLIYNHHQKMKICVSSGPFSFHVLLLLQFII